MKRLLFVASVCLGLFAFTVKSTTRNHSCDHSGAASGNYSSLLSDTTKKPDTSRPKPDTPKLAALLALQGK